MRVFTASVTNETNTFSPLRAGDADFAVISPGQHPSEPGLYTGLVVIARRECAARGWTLAEGLCADAQPAGLVNRRTWEGLRDNILASVRLALPLDMVVLGLHGAMVADGYPDCEGDLLTRVRALVGTKCAIGAVLDPHCHLTDEMTRAADILIAFKEYPHTDSLARAEEVWDLTLATAEGRVKPVISIFDCRMIAMFFTPIEPAAGLVRMMQAFEAEPGILSVTLIHGFPWGDTPAYGTRVLVISDADADRGGQIAKTVGQAVIAERGRTMTRLISVDDAVKLALEMAETPLVLADFADNPGAGCPSDSTWLIGAMMKAGMTDAAVAFVFDPVAVQIATAAGVGAKIDLRVGGKSSALSGPPLDLEVEVMHLTTEAIHDVGVVKGKLGNLAVVRAPGRFDFVLTSLRSQCFAPRAFSVFGVDPREKRVLVVKSMQHFYGAFSRLTDRIAYVDSPGVASLDLAALPFRHIDRSIWPFEGGMTAKATSAG